MCKCRLCQDACIHENTDYAVFASYKQELVLQCSDCSKWLDNED